MAEEEKKFFSQEQINSSQETNSAVVSSSSEPVTQITISAQNVSVYGDITLIPTQEAVQGIRYDFNSGLRVFFPKNGNKYHLKFYDATSNILLYDADADQDTMVSSSKKYYIKYKFEITRQGTNELVFEHTMDLKDKKVIVQFPVSTLGDSIGWFSYVERFQKKFGCKLTLVISDFLRDLVIKQYPDFNYINKDDVKNFGSYANYYVGLFFKGDRNYQPVDFRISGLHKTAGMILGLRTKEELEDIPPRIDLSRKPLVKGKYVVIATKASSQAKFWNNPFGWEKVIDFLKENGYKVYCIDKDKTTGYGVCFNHMPWGVEDDTGNKPLSERVDMIKDADFFIGLPSGLAWLAWCCKVPVVMISGFSLPRTEFYTPYRIINYNGCYGCWDDINENFDHSDYMWCPKHKDDPIHQFECSKIITPEQVIDMIKTIPTFKPKKD